MNLVKKIKSEQGASLLELLVALSLFATIIILATSIFKSVTEGQRNAISAQNVQENIRYAMEKMSREIRMATISNDDCLAGVGHKVYNTSDGTDLHFRNKNDDCVKYFLEANRLKITSGTTSGTDTYFITPSKVEVSNLKFYVSDDNIGAFHSKQPYVTMAMDVKAVGPARHEQKMKLQITVSSRHYE